MLLFLLLGRAGAFGLLGVRLQGHERAHGAAGGSRGRGRRQAGWHRRRRRRRGQPHWRHVREPLLGLPLPDHGPPSHRLPRVDGPHECLEDLGDGLHVGALGGLGDAAAAHKLLRLGRDLVGADELVGARELVGGVDAAADDLREDGVDPLAPRVREQRLAEAREAVAVLLRRARRDDAVQLDGLVELARRRDARHEAADRPHVILLSQVLGPLDEDLRRHIEDR